MPAGVSLIEVLIGAPMPLIEPLESLLGQRIAQAVQVEEPMKAMFGRPMPAVRRITGVVDQQ